MADRLTTPRAIAVALAVAGLAVAGCGKATGGGADTSMVPGAAQAPPPATRDVALLRWDLNGGEPATLDAARAFAGSDLEVDANICESLLSLTPEGSVEPGLAERVDRPDPLTYVVHLRPGVTFSDGRPLTADDVVFSMNRVRDPKLASYWAFFAQRVKSIRAVDAETVRIEMSKPDAIFYPMLATPMAQVVEKRYVERMGDRYGAPDGGVMCTGPYTLQRWRKGDSITLARNDRWWNRAKRPQRAAQVQFDFVTDDATLTSALSNGDVDGVYDPPAAAIQRLGGTAAAGGKQVFLGPSTRQQVLIPTRLSDPKSPLSNLKLREALAKSIDYGGVIKTFLAGTGEPLRAIVPPGGWGTAKDVYKAAYEQLPAPALDLAAAKRLVAESGVKSPAITIAVPGDIPQYRSLGETIQSNAQQAGFKVTLRSLPSADFYALFSDPKARAKVDAFFTDYYADIPDPLELYMQIGIPGGAGDFGGYKQPAVAKLLEQARGTVDDRRRALLTAQAQKQMTSDLVWIPIAYPYMTMYLRDGLAGASVAFPQVLYWPWAPGIGGR